MNRAGKIRGKGVLCIVDSFENKRKFDMRFDRTRKFDRRFDRTKRQLDRWVDMIQKVMGCKIEAIKMILQTHI